MPKNIIILITLLLCINVFYGQNSEDSLLFSIENKIYKCKNDTLVTDYLLQKIDVYINSRKIDSSLLNEIERVNWALIKDTTKLVRFFWNTSLTYCLNEKYHRAETFLSYYMEMVKSDSSINTQLFNALILMNTDIVKLNSLLMTSNLDSSIINLLNCYPSVINYSKKNRNTYLAASAIIPGSGMIALGKIRQGFISLALNGGVTYAVIALSQNNLYFNAVTWGLILVQKFYFGGIRLTGKLFDEKENGTRFIKSNACKENFQLLMQKYPINFK